IVPGSPFRYGSNLRIRTLYPRACRSAPRDAERSPLPSDETTPPVTKMNRAMGVEAYGDKRLTRNPRPRKNCANPPRDGEKLLRQRDARRLLVLLRGRRSRLQGRGLRLLSRRAVLPRE